MKTLYLYLISLLFIIFLVPSKTSALFNRNKNSNNCEREILEEKNKALVLEYYQKLFGDKDLKAIDEYLGDTYIQHNPFIEDGKEGIRKAVKEWLKDEPKSKVDFRRSGADGDLVWVHLKMKFDGKDNAVMDVFRVDNGKIVEHWDVVQVVPERSKNNNTMF